MTKDRKGSSTSRITSASASSLKNKKKKKSDPGPGRESDSDFIKQIGAQIENADNLETKSIPESDVGKGSGDVLAADAVENKDNENETYTYQEPSLTHIIISHYEGDTAANGLYDGYGEATFIGGNVYKGSFYRGVMQGKGVYVWKDGSLYEGDFSGNKITGFGIYKWSDQSTYEGEVLNGKRHGVGTFKSLKQGVTYSGQWYLGKRHGRGIMHYSEQSWYEGDWVNNSRHGYGVRKYRTGNVYEGYWTNDNRHGVGIMRWLTTNEAYHGDWENGVQHGRGTHTWYLQRVAGSQYPRRNEYVGDFINGLRHGRGKFFYASGSVYDGEWENSKKSGWGKLTFKNGRIFEGQFENDHMVDYPTFTGSGTASPDFTQIRTRTPLGWEEKEVCSDIADPGQNVGSGLALDISVLLEEFNENDRSEELDQVTHLLLRNITLLKRVYSFYSALGHDKVLDYTFVMSRFQFWRFLKDCKIHHHDYTLWSIDNAIAQCNFDEDIHYPLEKVLMRQFLSNLVVIAYKLYKEKVRDGKVELRSSKDLHDNKKSPVLGQCFQKLLDANILKYACSVNGYFMHEPRYASIALGYMEKCLDIYKSLCLRRRSDQEISGSLTMRQFMFFLRDLKIIGNSLNAQAILSVLSSDNPSVKTEDGATNLELKMTFLEFFEALIGCAMRYSSRQKQLECQQNVLSRPTSAVSHVESHQSMKQIVSMQSHNQTEEDTCNTTVSQKSQHANLSSAGVRSKTAELEHHASMNASKSQQPSGGFLQTLSQLSVRDHEDNTTTIDDGVSPYRDSVTPVGEKYESDENHNFRIWIENLSTFFSKILFPAWDFSESLKDAAEKNRLDHREKQRLENLQKEATKRLQSFQDKEEKEQASPRNVEEDENADECGSQAVSMSQESIPVQEPVRSSSSIKGKGKSGKKKK